MRQILLFAALAAVLALLLVSCGGTKDKPVPTEEDAPGKAAYHKISAALSGISSALSSFALDSAQPLSSASEAASAAKNNI